MNSEHVDQSMNQTKESLKAILNHDFSPCYELAERLGKDPELLEEFVKDPNSVAKREVEYTPPEGFHLHFMDHRNEMMPPEITNINDRGENETWGRVEIRTGIGNVCLFNCVYC